MALAHGTLNRLSGWGSMSSLRLSWPDLLAVSLVGWVGASLLWSTDPLEGLGRYQNWIAVLIVFLWARRADLSWLPYALSIAVIGEIGLHFWEPQYFGGFGNENLQAEFLWVALPFLFLRAHRDAPFQISWLVGIACLAFLFFINPSSAKWALLAVAWFAAIIFFAYHRKYWRVSVMLAASITLAIVFPWDILRESLLHRLELFTNTAFLWTESPIWGHGLGSFNAEYPRLQEAHLTVFPWMDTLLRPIATFPGSAHNEVLELMAITGVIGLGLAIAFVYTCLTSPPWTRRAPRASGCAALLVSLILAMFSFSYQNPAVALLCALSLGWVAQGAKEIRLSVPKMPVLAGGFAITSALLVTGGFAVSAERMNATARLVHDTNPSLAFMAANKSREIYPFDAWPRHQIILSLATGLAADTIEVSPRAADNIYQLSITAAPYSPAVAVARATYLLNSGRWFEEKRGEFKDILNHLHRVASIQGMTWVIEASYRARIGDRLGLAQAIENGMQYAMNHERDQLIQMAAGL